MAYDTFSGLVTAALVVFCVSTVGMVASPRLRQASPVRAAAFASGVVLLLAFVAFIAFMVMFVWTLHDLPDMSQF